ncbi:MAG: TlpA family protein disulfide reductase [Tidjanibacter sp.]|nr:TlpA family protein disulfide reductase [Tidjanibacter sp.]
MKRLLALLAFVVCTTLAWGQTTEGPAITTDEFAVVGVGERMPSFEVPMTNGTTIRSEELNGKVVLITLWASWCPSCRKEFSAIGKGAFKGLLENDNFVWLPIAREENVATVKAWFDKKGYDFVSGSDVDRAIYALFATQEIPRNIVVDRGGIIVHHSAGYTKKGFAELVERLENMLN